MASPYLPLFQWLNDLFDTETCNHCWNDIKKLQRTTPARPDFDSHFFPRVPEIKFNFLSADNLKILLRQIFAIKQQFFYFSLYCQPEEINVCVHITPLCGCFVTKCCTRTPIKSPPPIRKWVWTQLNTRKIIKFLVVLVAALLANRVDLFPLWYCSRHHHEELTAISTSYMVAAVGKKRRYTEFYHRHWTDNQARRPIRLRRCNSSHLV